MGIYLYGIKKLKRALCITREDGEVREVKHCLAYVSKPYWGFNGPSDRYTRLALGRLEHAYGDTFVGPVVAGECVLDWNGSPAWYDGGDYPKGTTVWGVLTDVVGDKEMTRASKARYPTCRVDLPREDGKGVVTHTLYRSLYVTHPVTKFVVAEREVYGVRLPDGRIQFRGGFHGPTTMDGSDPVRVMTHFDGYCAVNKDALIERTTVDPVEVPELPPAKPVYDHESAMAAAGWL